MPRPLEAECQFAEFIDQFVIPFSASDKCEIATGWLQNTQLDPQPVFWQYTFNTFRPFQHQRAITIHDVIEADAFRIAGVVEAITVHMKEALFVFLAFVFVYHIECRAGDSRDRAPAYSNARREDSFTSAHIPGKTDDISRLKQRTQPRPQALGLFRTVADNVEFALFQDWHRTLPG